MKSDGINSLIEQNLVTFQPTLYFIVFVKCIFSIISKLQFGKTQKKNAFDKYCCRNYNYDANLSNPDVLFSTTLCINTYLCHYNPQTRFLLKPYINICMGRNANRTNREWDKSRMGLSVNGGRS